MGGVCGQSRIYEGDERPTGRDGRGDTFSRLHTTEVRIRTPIYLRYLLREVIALSRSLGIIESRIFGIFKDAN